MFQEAFLTTYRTILEPIDLIRKLIHRYRLFANKRQDHSDMRVSSSILSSNEETSKNKKIDNLESVARVVAVSDEKFDFDRLNAENRRRKMAFSATRNSLTLLIRVLDGLE